jgi:ABC-type uncharacterized transport system substrate-binding protein
MERRRFAEVIAGGLLAAPLADEGQQAAKVYRIGTLERTSTVISAANLDGSRHGLRELGYVEGEDFVIEYRSADGRDERFPGLVTELVRLKVGLILTRGTPAALAAKNRLPALYASIEFAGGSIANGVNYPDQYRRAARFADTIFKGAQPADPPIEQPTELEFMSNLVGTGAVLLANVTQHVYQMARAAGFNKEDGSADLKIFERLAGMTAGKGQ